MMCRVQALCEAAEWLSGVYIAIGHIRKLLVHLVY